MERSEPSKSRKKHVAQVIGTGAVILVAAGTIGLSFEVMAAIVLGAATVLVLVP